MTSNKQALNVTELDFDAIKENLISYYSNSDSPFKDWDYAGSGLNILLDTLAYNTHYNALLAHLAVSEGFNDSAQLRSSVTSHAKLLGYTPRSYTAPSAIINVEFTPKNYGAAPPTISLPKGTAFSTNVNDKQFVFVTVDEYILHKGANSFIGENIVIKQGYYQTKKFQVKKFSQDPRLTYEIDDNQIDLSTLSVKVYQTASISVPEIYLKLTDISGVDENSRIYFVNENTNGNYQVSFGNNIIGKQPKNLSIIEFNYLVTDGEESNNANSFVFADLNPFELTRQPKITVVSKAAGGNERESIESIRYNAPLSFVTQDRAVTSDDYKNLIFKNFGEAQTISVWGGEDHNPPIYGKVFIAIKPFGANALTTGQKEEISAFLKRKKIISIFPELVDPEYLSLTLDVFFKYNKNSIALNKGELENNIRAVIKEYNDTVLQSFDGIFRYSSLTALIDSYNQSVLNSHIRVFVSKSFTIDPNNVTKKTINFSTELVPDDGVVIVNSSSFIHNNVELYFGDEENKSGPKEIRTIFTYYFKNGVRTKFNNVGTLNIVTGTLLLNEIFADELSTVTLDLMPISNDIAPKHNQLLQIDMSRLFVQGEADSGILNGTTYNTFKRDR